MRTFIFFSLFCLMSASVMASPENLILPKCQQEEVVETPITFFLSKEVKDDYSPYVREGMIQSWINRANLILKNSCVPMHRTLHQIVEVDELNLQEFESINVVHSMLEYYDPESIKEMTRKPNHYYGVIFSSKRSEALPPEHCGMTNNRVFPQFFTLDMACDKDTLEHELGHLAWAQHDIDTFSAQTEMTLDEVIETTPSHLKQFFKFYAFGYQCAGKGTIMSYADEVLPVYSSPEISYRGILCGNKKFANNALRLREYARHLRARLAVNSESVISRSEEKPPVTQ